MSGCGRVNESRVVAMTATTMMRGTRMRIRLRCCRMAGHLNLKGSNRLYMCRGVKCRRVGYLRSAMRWCIDKCMAMRLRLF